MNWKKYYNYIFIALVIVLIYGKSIAYEFNLDDELVTVGNARVEKGFAGISEIIKGYYYEDDMGYKYGYRPVSQITFAIEYQLLGENPHFSHFINVLLYILICSLIFYFLDKYTDFKNKWLALIITLLFAIHPLHVEAVVSIKNREELLAFLFPFAALLIALKAIDTKKWYLFIVVALFNFLAIYSKQSSLALIISVPVLLVLIRKLNYSYLALVFISFYPFLFVALKDNLAFNNLALMFFVGTVLFLSFSLLYYNYKKWFEYFNKEVWQHFDLILGLFVIITTILIAFYGYNIYLILSLIPLIFLLKNRDNIFLKVAFLFPIFLFLFHIQESWLVFLVILFIYESKFFSFEKLPFKKEWLFVVFYLIVSVWVSIVKQQFDFKFLPFLIFTLCQLSSSRIKLYSKYVLFILPLIFTITIFQSSFILDELVGLVLSLLILFNRFFKPFTKKIDANYKLVLIIPLLLPLLIYHFISIPIQFERSVLDYSEQELFNLNYSHQNTSFESRVINLTENPYYYYNSETDRKGLVLASALFYLKKFTVPFPLSSYYGYNVIQPVRQPFVQYLIIASFLILIASGVYFLRNKVLLLWMLFLALVSLVSISNYYEVISGIVGDRLGFTLVLPLFVLLSSGLFYLLRKQHRILYSILALLLVVLSVLSFFRVAHWETSEQLFATDVKAFPKSAKLHSLLGNTIMKNQSQNSNGFDLEKVKTAEYHFEQSIAIYPDFFNSYYDLARVNEITKNNEAAIKNYEYVIENDSTFYDVYLALTDLYLQKNKIKKAAENLENYLSYTGFNVDLYFELSNLVYQLGDYTRVITINQQIIQQNAQIPEAYLNIAYAYGQLGEIENLKQYLKLGEQLAPEHPDIQIVKQKFL